MTDICSRPFRMAHVLLTDECNFRCVYCFHDKHPQKMTTQTITRAIDWCFSMCDKSMHFEFFGGEPILNWPVLQIGVQYGRMRAKDLGKTVSFGMVTNASLLTMERAMWCKNNNIGALLSYDGPFTNEATRGHTRDVETGMRNALAAGMRASVAMQLPAGHTKYVYENFTAIERMGFHSIAINPVTHCYNPYTDEDWRNIVSGMKRIAEHQYERYATGKGATYSQLSNQIRTMQNMAKIKNWTPHDRDASCGACKGSIAIDASGNIVPCQQMPAGSGFDHYIMGNVLDDAYDAAIREQVLNTRHVDMCRECPAIRCGSCRTINYWATGNEYEPCLESCMFQLKLLEINRDLYNRLVANKIIDGVPLRLYRPIDEAIADLKAHYIELGIGLPMTATCEDRDS